MSTPPIHKLQQQVLSLGHLVKELSMQASSAETRATSAEARAQATHQELLQLRDVVLDVCTTVKALQEKLSSMCVGGMCSWLFHHIQKYIHQ